MEFYISKKAQSKILEAFKDADVTEPVIRLQAGDNLDLEFLSVEPEDYNEDTDLLLTVNTIKILIDQDEVKYFNNIHLDYNEEKQIFLFLQR